MRRLVILTALVMLTLLLVMGSASVSAKPAGGSNSANAKQCQKGGYANLAKSETPDVAFTTEEACVSYGALGGILTAYVPESPSSGCQVFNMLYSSTFISGGGIGGYTFNAGERITVSAAPPTGVYAPPTTVSLAVGVNSLFETSTQSTAFGGTLSFVIPANGVYHVYFSTNAGYATWTNSCSV